MTRMTTRYGYFDWRRWSPPSGSDVGIESIDIHCTDREVRVEQEAEHAMSNNYHMCYAIMIQSWRRGRSFVRGIIWDPSDILARYTCELRSVGRVLDQNELNEYQHWDITPSHPYSHVALSCAMPLVISLVASSLLGTTSARVMRTTLQMLHVAPFVAWLL